MTEELLFLRLSPSEIKEQPCSNHILPYSMGNTFSDFPLCTQVAVNPKTPLFRKPRYRAFEVLTTLGLFQLH